VLTFPGLLPGFIVVVKQAFPLGQAPDSYLDTAAIDKVIAEYKLHGGKIVVLVTTDVNRYNRTDPAHEGGLGPRRFTTVAVYLLARGVPPQDIVMFPLNEQPSGSRYAALRLADSSEGLTGIKVANVDDLPPGSPDYLEWGTIPGTGEQGLIFHRATQELNFTAIPTSGPAPLSVAFLPTGVPPGATCAWNFGDNGTAAECSPNHIYNQPGTYTVKLTATAGDQKKEKTREKYIVVTAVSPSVGPPGSEWAVLFEGLGRLGHDSTLEGVGGGIGWTRRIGDSDWRARLSGVVGVSSEQTWLYKHSNLGWITHAQLQFNNSQTPFWFGTDFFYSGSDISKVAHAIHQYWGGGVHFSYQWQPIEVGLEGDLGMWREGASRLKPYWIDDHFSFGGMLYIRYWLPW
jgi:hypothetical protein